MLRDHRAYMMKKFDDLIGKLVARAYESGFYAGQRRENSPEHLLAIEARQNLAKRLKVGIARLW